MKFQVCDIQEWDMQWDKACRFLIKRLPEHPTSILYALIISLRWCRVVVLADLWSMIARIYYFTWVP